MQLAGPRFADPHAKPGFTEREGLAVVPLENLALARWQAGHRGAHTRAKVLRLVALREFVLLRPPVVPALDELIERYGPAIGGGVALPTPCPQQGRVRQGPPPPRRTPTKDPV